MTNTFGQILCAFHFNLFLKRNYENQLLIFCYLLFQCPNSSVTYIIYIFCKFYYITNNKKKKIKSELTY